MNDHIEVDGRKYVEEGYLRASNAAVARRDETIASLEAENARLKMKLDQRTEYIENQHVGLCEYVNEMGPELVAARAENARLTAALSSQPAPDTRDPKLLLVALQQIEQLSSGGKGTSPINIIAQAALNGNEIPEWPDRRAEAVDEVFIPPGIKPPLVIRPIKFPDPHFSQISTEDGTLVAEVPRPFERFVCCLLNNALAALEKTNG